MTGLTLDAGALIAVERGNTRVIGLLERAVARGETVAIPAAALAQAWRAHPRQHSLHVLLGSEQAEVVPLDLYEALLVGVLCARGGHADIVDVSVVSCASARGHVVITSDPHDLAAIDPDVPLIGV